MIDRAFKPGSMENSQRLADEQDRRRGSGKHFRGDRSHDQITERTISMGTHDNHVYPIFFRMVPNPFRHIADQMRDDGWEECLYGDETLTLLAERILTYLETHEGTALFKFLSGHLPGPAARCSTENGAVEHATHGRRGN